LNLSRPDATVEVRLNEFLAPLPVEPGKSIGPAVMLLKNNRNFQDKKYGD